MKRRKIKYTSAFFLWLAWLVINAHLVIPHDHHSSDVFGNKDEECPVSDTKPAHNHGFPAHCHAFNDLTAEKFVKFIVSKNIQSDYISISCKTDDSNSWGTPITISESGRIFEEPDFLYLSPLRAPPVIS